MARVGRLDYSGNVFESRADLFVGECHFGGGGGGEDKVEEVHRPAGGENEGGGVFVLGFGHAFDWEELGVNEGGCVSNDRDIDGVCGSDYACEVYGESTAHAEAACECSGGTGAGAAAGKASPWALYVDGDEGVVGVVGGGDDGVGVLLG